MPANGPELQRRVNDFDARLAKQGLCQPGELVKHLTAKGRERGYGTNLAGWSGAAIAFAIEIVREFAAARRQPRQPGDEDPAS